MGQVKLSRRMKQLIARIGYYGICYPFQYFLLRIGLLSEIPVVKRKESHYHLLTEKQLPSELEKWYHAATGEKLDLSNPVTFTQKIQWSKIYDKNPLRTTLSDKYAVRKWVADMIGQEYLTPLLGVWDSFEKIDFSKLPSQYVLKCTHGTHCNMIVRNDKPLDYELAKSKFNTWIKKNYAYISFEMQYKDIPPRIIAEEYMENGVNDLYDYKFHCFGGKVVYIDFLMDRNHGLRDAIRGRNWEKLPFTDDDIPVDEEIEKPEHLEKMVEIAEKLSSSFPYVRVDLYRLNDGSIRFGEMTFTPAGGGQNYNPRSTDYELGKLWKMG